VQQSGADTLHVICPECGREEQLNPQQYCCACGSAFEPAQPHHFSVRSSETGLWRYIDMFMVDFDTPLTSMGNVCTPLLPAFLHGCQVHFKLEYLSPTGSFKDRGTALMINILAHQGVYHVIDDSSGNAGASVAAYAARAGMAVDIFVPSYASQVKQAQIAIYGAAIHPVPGPRSAAKQAALAAATGDAVLASHAYHPGFLAGQQSVAWEVYEQLGGKAPDWYVVPAGQGVHLLGAFLGFSLLKRLGRIKNIPRLIAVQPELLAPIKHALDRGLDEVPPAEAQGHSAAEGLAIVSPVRGKRILQAIRASNGDCLTVTEDQILAAQSRAAGMGFYVEPTSATAIAALDVVLRMARKEDIIVVPLTGSGLKGVPSKMDHTVAQSVQAQKEDQYVGS
jgi:threonine synthase